MLDRGSCPLGGKKTDFSIRTKPHTEESRFVPKRGTGPPSGKKEQGKKSVPVEKTDIEKAHCALVVWEDHRGTPIPKKKKVDLSHGKLNLVSRKEKRGSTRQPRKKEKGVHEKSDTTSPNRWGDPKRKKTTPLKREKKTNSTIKARPPSHYGRKAGGGKNPDHSQKKFYYTKKDAAAQTTFLLQGDGRKGGCPDVKKGRHVKQQETPPSKGKEGKNHDQRTERGLFDLEKKGRFHLQAAIGKRKKGGNVHRRLQGEKARRFKKEGTLRFPTQTLVCKRKKQIL